MTVAPPERKVGTRAVSWHPAALCLASLLGQHTAEVLREHGFSREEIASLVERNIAWQAKT